MHFKTSKIFILMGFLAVHLFADNKPMKWLGTFSTAPISAKDGDAYHNSLDNKSYVLDNKTWSILADVSVGPQGNKGDAGTNGTNGVDGAKGDKGDKGDQGSFPTGTAAGDMQYWNGSAWVMVPKGKAGQILTETSSQTPAWTNPTIVTDIDGNIYSTVTIGTQTWMKQDLKTTRYNDGVAIPLVTDNTAWAALTTPGYCLYNNTNNADSIRTFGALYNWYALNTGKLAPTGWHVATDAEWTTLTTYLGGESVAGGNLKEAGLAHWISPNVGATNETGFSALPGGFRGLDGYFYNQSNFGGWWSATESYATTAWRRTLSSYYANLSRYNSDPKSCGFSVRLVKD